MSQRAHGYQVGEICICRDIGEPWWPGVICGFAEGEEHYPHDTMVHTKWIFGGFECDLGTTVPVSRVLKWDEGVPQFSKSMGKQHRYLKTPRKLAIVVAEGIKSCESVLPAHIKHVLEGEEKFKSSVAGVTEVVMSNFVFEEGKYEEANGLPSNSGPPFIKKEKKRGHHFSKHGRMRGKSGSAASRRIMGNIGHRIKSADGVMKSESVESDGARVSGVGEGRISRRSAHRTRFRAWGFETAEAERCSLARLKKQRQDRWGGQDFIELRRCILGESGNEVVANDDGAHCGDAFWVDGVGTVNCETCHGPSVAAPTTGSVQSGGKLSGFHGGGGGGPRVWRGHKLAKALRQMSVCELPLVLESMGESDMKVSGALSSDVKLERAERGIDEGCHGGPFQGSYNKNPQEGNFAFFVFPPPARPLKVSCGDRGGILSDIIGHSSMPKEGLGNLMLGQGWMTQDIRLAIAGGYAM